MEKNLEQLKNEYRDVCDAIIQRKKVIIKEEFGGNNVIAREIGTNGELELFVDYRYPFGELIFRPYKKNGELSKSIRYFGYMPEPKTEQEFRELLNWHFYVEENDGACISN